MMLVISDPLRAFTGASRGSETCRCLCRQAPLFSGDGEVQPYRESGGTMGM